MPTFAPGFITVASRSMGVGEGSLAIAHIVAISPTRQGDRYDSREQCTCFLAGGGEVVLYQPRDAVLQAIAEAAGASPIGTGDQINAIHDALAQNTQRLVAAIQTNTQDTP